MRIPRRLLGRAQGRGCPRLPPPPKTQNQYFSTIFRGLGPGNPWKRSPGTIRIHMDTSQINFQYFVGHSLDIFRTVCEKRSRSFKQNYHIAQDLSWCPLPRDPTNNLRRNLWLLRLRLKYLMTIKTIIMPPYQT